MCVFAQWRGERVKVNGRRSREFRPHREPSRPVECGLKLPAPRSTPRTNTGSCVTGAAEAAKISSECDRRYSTPRTWCQRSRSGDILDCRSIPSPLHSFSTSPVVMAYCWSGLSKPLERDRRRCHNHSKMMRAKQVRNHRQQDFTGS